MSALTLAALGHAIAAAGLSLRGSFRPSADDGAPTGTRWLCLLGTVGGSVWPAFAASSEAADGEPDPLDRWSRRVIQQLAHSFGGKALFPFGGPPFQPFLRWAQQAEGLEPSPIGMLIHPEHGLWHAYRGALAFASVPPDWQEAPPAASPCRRCAARPCRSACPVDAFTDAGYDVAACRRHLATPAGRRCFTQGCLARRACPVAPGLRYSEPQTRFHMRAFLGAAQTEREG